MTSDGFCCLWRFRTTDQLEVCDAEWRNHLQGLLHATPRDAPGCCSTESELFLWLYRFAGNKDKHDFALGAEGSGTVIARGQNVKHVEV